MPRIVGCEHCASKRCDECDKVAKRAWYEKNKEREQAKAKAYYEAHKEELCAKKRGTYVSSPALREYQRIYQKMWREKYPEKQSASLYGALYPEGVNKALLREKQGGKCGSCAQLPRPKDGLVTDHDHGMPGRPNVRGLLHSTCNSGAGLLGDTWEGVQQMADYLKAWEQPFDTVWDYP